MMHVHSHPEQTSCEKSKKWRQHFEASDADVSDGLLDSFQLCKVSARKQSVNFKHPLAYVKDSSYV